MAEAGRPDGPATATVRVLPEGLLLGIDPAAAVDVLFDGRRIWSFRPEQVGAASTDDAGGLVWSVPWPKPIEHLLDGYAEVEVRDPGGEVLGGELVRFGERDEPVAIVDREGRPIAVFPNGRTYFPFEADSEARAGLLVAARAVLDVMADVGLTGFLAYGTLLGAVRDGDFIGHDDDVDLGYVSSHTEPTDVVRESLRLERALVRAGMEVERYSGAGLKVHVLDHTGVLRGLDIFGGMLRHGRLALLGEILAPYDEKDLYPLSTVTLAGEEFPAPARPEALLELMYGPSWRVPDPTFSFDPETAARDQLGRWFRGVRERRNAWNRWYLAVRHDRPFLKPHHVARLLHRDEPAGSTVIDVGCGRGQDAAWLAEQGHPVVGLDYSLHATGYHLERARAAGWPFEAHTVNLLGLRQSLSWGARLAREVEGPRSVLARHFVNAAPVRAREGLYRLSSMVLRGGGRLYLEFFDSEEPRDYDKDDLVWEVDARDVAAEVTAAGGVVESVERFDPNWFELPWRTSRMDPKPVGCRMTVRWP